jgi:Beta-1,3-glucanase/F5/8 type C domain
MSTRRNVLRWAATAAVSAPLLALAGRTAAFGATRLPITVVNNTGLYPNSAIWMYVVGTNLTTGQQSYVRADGTLIPASPSLNGPDGYADLSIPFQPTLSLPNMSGRIYFSINQKLKFRVVTDGNGRAAFQYPAGWVSSDPSFSVLHDCMEFTFGGGGMFCNTTMVDMFSVPMAIQLSGASNQTIGTLKPGGRDAIFAAIAALPDFKSLIQGNNLRVVAPGHGIEGGMFSSTYYDSYVNDVWNTYTGQDLRVKINATTYTGRVSGGQLRFDGGVAPFAKPSTQDVFYCNGALGAPNDGLTGPVAAVLGAAFNRSTLRTHPDQPVTDPSAFYQEAKANHYSQVIHQNMVDGKAYGFPFDDVGNFASYIQDTAPTAMKLTLTPFGTGGSTTPPSTGLLSQGRPATASSVENSGTPAAGAFDGSTATRWSSQFADPQWLRVDLGASRSVTRVRLTWEAAYAKAYQIQTSADGSTWSTVYSTTTGTGGVEDRTFTASTGRYVRVLGTQRATQYGYSLWEMEVYGS